jgi:hypothetical protein
MGPREVLLPTGQVSERSVNSSSEALFNHETLANPSRLIKPHEIANQNGHLLDNVPRQLTRTGSDTLVPILAVADTLFVY